MNYEHSRKAEDIPDDEFLRAVELSAPYWDPPKPGWSMIWDVETRLNAHRKIVLAKARRLIKRGVMHGCACGCRGDFHLPHENCC